MRLGQRYLECGARFTFMSIKRKLTLMMIGISVTAVLLTIVGVSAFLIYDVRASKAKELAVTAAITGDRNSAALLFLDNESVQHNLEIFQLSPSVMTACIYNEQGVLFAGYQASGSGMNCAQDTSALQRSMVGMFIILQEIQKNGQVIGNVYITADTREIEAYIQRILMISGLVMLLVCAMVWPLTVYLQRTISQPILELAETAERITKNNDYSIEAKTGYKDETGVLARAFNDMIRVISERDFALQHVNETLEQKVQVRTKQLEASKHKAEMASQAKSEFLRNMSHEFRTPLHAMISFSSYGIKEYESAERTQLKQYFEMMQKGAQRLARLVDGVLDLARMEQGEQIFAMQRARVKDVIQRASETVESLIKEKGLTLEIACKDEALEAVCDQDKIVQVLTNLLGNAIKFTPSGKRIIIEAVVDDQPEHDRKLTLSVIDEGIGIPDDEVEMIFESFRQSSRTDTGAGGTGLGLAICRNIVMAHHGRIWAENNTNQSGARVCFTMPCVLAEGNRVVTTKTMEVPYGKAA
jgi:two-component system, sensor histidine kinase and response regulator